MIWILALLSCGTPTDSPNPGVDDTAEVEGLALEALEAPRLLRRLSLDLRGVVPTLEELEAVEADPELVEEYRDAWVHDDGIAERLVPLLGEHWATLGDEIPASPYDYGYSEQHRYAFNRSVGQEPLRLMAQVVIEDRPWSDILTADFSMANEYLGPNWPMDGYPEDGTGWHKVSYNDGRPAVGVLATNGLWWRYGTSTFNESRTRAEAIVRLLICKDLLQRPVSFAYTDDLNALTGTVDMIRSDPACLACHSAVEPISAALFGFWPVLESGPIDHERYHQERESQGPEQLLVEPAWYGKPITGLSELGPAIAEDPRFTQCSVKTFGKLMLRRPMEVGDQPVLDELHEEFVQTGLDVRELLVAITDLPEYRAGSVEGDEEDLDRVITARSMTPSLLDSSIEDLTGFAYVVNQVRYFDDDQVGYRSLAGGADGVRVTELRPEPTLTSVLAAQRLFEAAVAHAANQAWRSDTPDGPFAELPMAPGEDELREALDDLHFMLLARRPSEDELADLVSLWQTLAELEEDEFQGPELAWMGVWTLLLRDPAFVSY